MRLIYSRTGLYKFNCITTELPTLHHVDTIIHWELGNIYRIWNLKDSVMMDFHLGVSTRYRGVPKEKLTTNKFVIDTIIDDFEKWNDRFLKRKRVVLQTKRQIKEESLPFFVEFTCYLDFTDLQTCKSIILSVQMSKDCLEDNE